MQLFINGKEVDLSADERIAITLQACDMGDISRANTSYSNSFKVPKTANNVSVMEYLGVPGTVTRIPYQLNNVTLIEDSIVLVNNGYGVISETIDTHYSINVYGAEKAFFEKIRQYTIKETYGLRSILWSAQNLLNYLNPTSDFCFPVAQYNAETIHSGSLQNSGNVFSRTKAMSSSPHFFVKTLFQKIFSFLGYSLEYPMQNDFLFGNLVMPAGKGISKFPAVHGEFFNVQNLVPEISCDVFIREIMQRYGLIVQVDETAKKVTFKRMQDLILNGTVADWTDKFVEFKNEKYSMGKYGQKNYFKYSEDVENEFYPTQYPADELMGTFELDNETLDKEVTIIESNFQKAQYYRFSETNNSAKGRIFFHTQGGASYNLLDVAENEQQDNGDLKEKEVPHQLMYLYPIGTLSFSFIEPDGTTRTQSISGRACSNSNISFQQYINTNYSQIINLLNNMHLIKVRMKLSLLDVYNFDFFKRIYLQQYGAFFYLNKISNFEKDKLTEVELIRIPPIQ